MALVAADLHLPDDDGVEFLEQARGPAPGRRPGAAAGDGPSTTPGFRSPSLPRCSARPRSGRIDFWVVKGWVNPEEWLYPQVQEALTAWTSAHRPSHVVYRIVGEQWDPRSHDLRDVLTVNGVPFEFHPPDSDTARQLISDHDVDVSRLPAVIHHDGAVLQDPTLRRARRPPRHPDPARAGESTTWRRSAPDRPGWPPPSTARRRGCAPSSLEAHAIGGQAGTSSMIRNYLGFPRGISGGELAHRAWEQATAASAPSSSSPTGRPR